MGKKHDGEPEEELNLDDGADDGGDTGDEAEEGAEQSAEDRGDNPNPEDTPENLRDVAGEEGEEADDEAKKSKYIPHSRFNEVNESLKTERAARLALEEENARLRGGAPAKKADGAAEDQGSKGFDHTAKEEEYADALMEGDKKRAAAIRTEINAAVRREAEEAATSAAEKRILSREQERAFKSAVSDVVADYPFLDSKHKQADQDAIAEVVSMRNYYIESKGMSPADALRKAADQVAKIKGVKAASDKDDGDDEGEEPARPAASADQLAKLRRERALRRNADSANRQPARVSTAGNGNRAGNLAAEDVEGMSETRFKSIPDSEKKKLRGDFV